MVATVYLVFIVVVLLVVAFILYDAWSRSKTGSPQSAAKAQSDRKKPAQDVSRPPKAVELPPLDYSTPTDANRAKRK